MLVTKHLEAYMDLGLVICMMHQPTGKLDRRVTINQSINHMPNEGAQLALLWQVDLTLSHDGLYLLSEAVRDVVPARDVEVKGDVCVYKVCVLQGSGITIIHCFCQVQVSVEEDKRHVGPSSLQVCTACTPKGPVSF